MLSQILVLALISSHIVLSQTPEGSDITSNDMPNGDDLVDYISPDDSDYPQHSPVIDFTINYDDMEETTPYPQNYIDDDWYDFGPTIYPSDGNFTIDESLPALEVVSPQQNIRPTSSGYDFTFWFYVIYIMIGAVVIILFWVYCIYDLRKERRRGAPNSRRQSSGGVAMDQRSAESGANQTAKSPVANGSKSKPSPVNGKGVESASNKPKNMDQSDETVRSSLGEGGASSIRSSITSNEGNNKRVISPSKSSVKADPKRAKSDPKVTKQKPTTKIDPSKTTLSSV